MSLCAACGRKGHRYGRNEGMDRFDPQACINGLIGENERLRGALNEVDDLLGSFRRLIDAGGTVGKEQVKLARQIAQAELPRRVSVDEVVGIFDGPDSVEWLREQRR